MWLNSHDPKWLIFKRPLTAGAHGFIQKPFSMVSLSEKLKVVLKEK